jgi:uncharacterized membrane protein
MNVEVAIHPEYVQLEAGMNWPHIHLMLNHAPVMGVLLALVLLLVGMFRDRSGLKEAAFITLVLTGALAAIVYYTGDAAGELLGGLPDISKADLLAHGSMALYALAGAAASGVMAVGALVVSRRSATSGTWFLALSLLLAAVTAFLMLQTANLGGRMRHPEIQKRSAAGLVPGWGQPRG